MVISNEILDDIELIKNTWLNLDYKICLLENIFFYYSYIFYNYYGNSYESRKLINEKITDIIFKNRFNLIKHFDKESETLFIVNDDKPNETNKLNKQLKISFLIHLVLV